MKLWFKKLTTPATNETKEMEVAQLWLVRWKSRKGEYSYDLEKQMEGFPSESEAIAFKDALMAANKLLKNTGPNLEVTLEKN